MHERTQLAKECVDGMPTVFKLHRIEVHPPVGDARNVLAIRLTR